MTNLLPIGSVVLLEGAQRKLMIYGRLQRQDEQEKIWDYIGCLYPEGQIRPEDSYLFDHKGIETVVFTGYQNEEEVAFQKYMSEELSKLTGELNIVEDVL